MLKKKYLFIGTAFVVMICAALVLVFVLKKKPVELTWTRENSLLRMDLPPGISESGGGSDVQHLLEAIGFSLSYLDRLEPAASFVFGREVFSVRQMKESLEDFREKLVEFGLTESFYRYVTENFTFYRSAADEVLFTGYYEALLKGSRERSETYNYPLYKTPGDLVRVDLPLFSFYEKFTGLPKVLRGRLSGDRRVVPYYSREEIDSKNVLAGRGLEMLWIDNPVDVFFLHIQGSGIVELETGEKVRVNYDDSNGQAYRAIGRLMVERGMLTLENASMQSIRAYLASHPGEVDEILNYNPSYVFFREVEEGPMGCLGVPVTAFRSIATDRELFPDGALCFIETELPVFDSSGELKAWKPFRSFVLNQDTGGAIRTPGRVDLFTGHGEGSELVAGYMKRSGNFYFLIKRK